MHCCACVNRQRRRVLFFHPWISRGSAVVGKCAHKSVFLGAISPMEVIREYEICCRFELHFASPDCGESGPVCFTVCNGDLFFMASFSVGLIFCRCWQILFSHFCLLSRPVDWNLIWCCLSDWWKFFFYLVFDSLLAKQCNGSRECVCDDENVIFNWK